MNYKEILETLCDISADLDGHHLGAAQHNVNKLIIHVQALAERADDEAFRSWACKRLSKQ